MSAIAGKLGRGDGVVIVGVKFAAVFVSVGNAVTLGVNVLMSGVADALVTPITTGVGVKIFGTCVYGKKGVGGLPGSG